MSIYSLIKPLGRLVVSKTARNTYFVFLGNSLSMILGFFFTVIVARSLSFSDFGYFSALLSLLLLSSDIADIGIGTSLSRFLPPMEKNKRGLLSFLKTAFLLQVSIASLVAGMIFSFSIYISNALFHYSNLSTLVRITSLGIFSSIMANFFLYTLHARQRFLSASFLIALSGFLRVATLFLLIGFFYLNLQNIVWGQVISLIIFAVAGIIIVGSDFLQAEVKVSNLVKLISFSIYLGIARGLTAVVGKLDVLMLISLTNSTQAGIYSVASRVISLYPLLSGSFINVIAPKIASIRIKKELKQFLFKTILATFGLVFSILILIILAPFFMTLLFGVKKGLPAVSVFRLLLFSMVFFVGSIPAVSLAIFYLKKPHILTLNSILQLTIVIIGNFVFIPLWGRIGPAISLSLAYGISFVLTTYLSFYYFFKK